MIRALTAASHPFYREQAGGLADHPVLAPRGALSIGRADQLGALDALHADIRTEVPDLERLDGAQTCARVTVLRADYIAGGVNDPTSMDLDVAAIHQGYLKGLRARGGRVITGAEVRAIATDAPRGRPGRSNAAPGRRPDRCSRARRSRRASRRSWRRTGSPSCALGDRHAGHDGVVGAGPQRRNHARPVLHDQFALDLHARTEVAREIDLYGSVVLAITQA